MILKALLRLIITAAALIAISYVVPGITVSSFYIALVVALIWGILGLTLRPILHLLSLPLNILTLGLFSFIVNALLFWLLSTFIAGFHVAGFVPALEGSVLLAVVSWALHAAL